MPREIKIKVGKVELTGELGDTTTALKVYQALPLEAAINTWGDEFYFSTRVSEDLDDTATRVVNVGDIGYWPPDNAVCIFFGPTPASNGPEPVPASEVNIIGRVLGDARVLKKVMSEKSIRIEKVMGDG